MPHFAMAPTPVAIPPHPAHMGLTHQESTDRARAYKSRNKRPCDFCRYKKAACHLDNQPPCELCIRYNKECTFVESPAKRRRPNDNNPESQRLRQNGSFDAKAINVAGQNAFVGGPLSAGSGAMDMQQELMHWQSNMPPFGVLPDMGMTPGMEFGAFDPALYREPSMNFEAFEPMSATGAVDPALAAPQHVHRSSIDTTPSQRSATLPSSMQQPLDTTSAEPSLDNQPSSNAQIVGMSGESDPYLLSRYRFDQYNEASFGQIRMRKMCDANVLNGGLPTYFTIQHNGLASKAQPPERNETLERYRREVDEMVSDDVGKRLIALFYKYVQPYFPVLSRSHGQTAANGALCDPSSVPTCILAAIYGHALPFCAWDEKLCIDVYTPPSADALFRIAWLACLPMLHTPSLAVLQTLLLLVQRRPTNKHVSDTPFKWVIMTTAVSIAESLGITRDPGEWPLPSWEIKLRRRLAWATFVQDKWLALNFGRSSHISADDWDVQPLDEDDLEDPERVAIDESGLLACEHFLRLCELTEIVADLLRDLFSIRATRVLHNSLEATLEAAKPLRIRLTEWHQCLPAGLLKPSTTAKDMPSPNSPSSTTSPGRSKPTSFRDLDGNGSLHLAYITAKIELYRAMLRPRPTHNIDPQISNKPTGAAAATSALRTGALSVATEIYTFLDSLTAHQLEAFWSSYSRANFTIASSFLLHLFVSAPEERDARECLGLLESWRSGLRLKSRSCDLLNLALLRLDAVFVKEGGLEGLVELTPAAREAWGQRRGSLKSG